MRKTKWAAKIIPIHSIMFLPKRHKKGICIYAK